MNALDFASEYIHKESMGNREYCISAALKVQTWLKEQYAGRRIQGWETNYIDKPETLEEKLIFIEVDKISDLKYPFLQLSVQAEKTILFEINKSLIEFGFSKIE